MYKAKKMMIGKEEYIRVIEVSKMLGASTSTIRDWTRRGLLKEKRHPMNQYRLYKKNDVEALLKSWENLK